MEHKGLSYVNKSSWTTKAVCASNYFVLRYLSVLIFSVSAISFFLIHSVFKNNSAWRLESRTGSQTPWEGALGCRQLGGGEWGKSCPVCYCRVKCRICQVSKRREYIFWNGPAPTLPYFSTHLQAATDNGWIGFLTDINTIVLLCQWIPGSARRMKSICAIIVFNDRPMHEAPAK